MKPEPSEEIEKEEPEETTADNGGDVREVVEQLPGYQEYLKELQGDRLTFGDY